MNIQLENNNKSEWKEISITKVKDIKGIISTPYIGVYKWKPFNNSKHREDINVDDLHNSIRKLYEVFFDLNLFEFDYTFRNDEKCRWEEVYTKWDRVNDFLNDLNRYNNYEYQFSTNEINSMIFYGNVIYDYYNSMNSNKMYYLDEQKIGRKKTIKILETEFNEDLETFINRLKDEDKRRLKNGMIVFERYLKYFQRTDETINWMKYLNRNWKINYSDDMKGLSQFLKQKRIVGMTMIKLFIKTFIGIYNLNRKNCGKKTVKNGHFSYQITIYNDNSWGVKVYSKDYLRGEYHRYTIPFNETVDYINHINCKDEIYDRIFSKEERFDKEKEIEHNVKYDNVKNVGYKYFLQKYSTDDKMLFNNNGNHLKYEIIKCNLPIKGYGGSSDSYRVFVYENDNMKLGKKNILKNIERKSIYHININE
jgi:hypothetical protein